MPTSLSRLSSCLSSILSFLECPICFEIISPPAQQCPLGHLICFRCRVYIDRCPICRTGFTRERSLLADQIYDSIIEAFHLNNHSTGERTKKLWERVFGRKKRVVEKQQQQQQQPSSQPTTPKLARAFEIKNKFLTRLIGKSSSVDNLSNESLFGGGSDGSVGGGGGGCGSIGLRKKSISTTDIYPESLKKLGSQYNADQCSVESLPAHHHQNGDTNLSRYSSFNSCEKLNGARNVQYFKRLRNRTLYGSKTNNSDNVENLFQFSTDPAAATDDDGQPRDDLFHCPLAESCAPRNAFSLLTHLQEHDGPVIQYFKPKFTVHFPFSFENGAVFIVHCYEKTFYTRLSVDEVEGDIKVYFWIMDGRSEGDKFKLKLTIRNDESNATLEFKSVANSIKSTEIVEDVHKHQILITKSTLHVCFGEKFYSFDLYLKKRKS